MICSVFIVLLLKLGEIEPSLVSEDPFSRSFSRLRPIDIQELNIVMFAPIQS